MILETSRNDWRSVVVKLPLTAPLRGKLIRAIEASVAKRTNMQPPITSEEFDELTRVVLMIRFDGETGGYLLANSRGRLKLQYEK